VVRIILEKCAHRNQTNHTIDLCWELHGKLSWPSRVAYLSGTVGSSSAHDSNTLDTSANESVTLSKSGYDFLIQKMHSISISDITILARPSISYLVSS